MCVRAEPTPGLLLSCVPAVCIAWRYQAGSSSSWAARLGPLPPLLCVFSCTARRRGAPPLRRNSGAATVVVCELLLWSGTSHSLAPALVHGMPSYSLHVGGCCQYCQWPKRPPCAS